MKKGTLSKFSSVPDTEEACCLAQSISYANSDFSVKSEGRYTLPWVFYTTR